MSTDKTLADVQPGGKARLGDQAERARFEAWAEGASLNIARFNHGGYCDERTVSAWLAWLSAQPSQGGQGAPFPWENFPAYLIDKCEGDTISEEGLQQALAAMAKDERYGVAARQPVGEQPVGHLFRVVASDEGAAQPWKGRNIVYTEGPAPVEGRSGSGQYMNVYAAPPAQAVDLGQFRDLAEFALSNAKLHNCWEKREALARDLLALIDSQAVGK